jgi:TIR domain
MLPATAPAVFISYAHADNQSPDPQKCWLDRFVEFLKPLVRQEDFTLCSDLDLKIGDGWHERIQEHLNAAKAAVLLVSPAFLASDYIADSELPVILKKAADKGVKILPIIISPSLYEETRFKYPDPRKGPEEFTLASSQAANAPSKTLVEMDEGERNRVFLKVARRLSEILRENPRPSLEAAPAAGPKSALSNLPDRNPFFTGRDHVLAQLREALAAWGRAALSGLGGIGKSQTAVEYAYRHAGEYDYIFLATAASRETLVSS